MSPNGSDISVVINNDPSWASIDEVAARSKRANFVHILRGKPTYRPGHEFRKAEATETAEKMRAIHDGFAETEPQPVEEQKTTNQEAIDFDAPHGMVAGIKDKAEKLPSYIASSIITGFGTIDRAAIDSWRLFTTVSSPAVAQLPPTLGRGISR